MCGEFDSNTINSKSNFNVFPFTASVMIQYTQCCVLRFHLRVFRLFVNHVYDIFIMHTSPPPPPVLIFVHLRYRCNQKALTVLTSRCVTIHWPLPTLHDQRTRKKSLPYLELTSFDRSRIQLSWNVNISIIMAHSRGKCCDGAQWNLARFHLWFVRERWSMVSLFLFIVHGKSSTIYIYNRSTKTEFNVLWTRTQLNPLCPVLLLKFCLNQVVLKGVPLY